MFEFLKQKSDGTLVDFFVDYLTNKKTLTELALEVGLNRIADVIAKCGFQVISKEDVSAIDYALNVKPNPNQYATDFWKQAVYRMIKDAEGCLIVNLGARGLFIADSWITDDSVLKERKYSNVCVVVDGRTMNLGKTFKASDVVHLRYSNPSLMALLREANGELNGAYSAAVAGFNTKVPKIKVSVPANMTLMDSETGKVITSNEYAEKIASKLSDGEIRSIVAHSGIDVSAIDTKSTLSSADVKALKEEIFGNVAIALGIPKSILFSDTVSQANTEFITYACEPIISIIDNALCGSWLSQEEYERGDRIIVNKLCVRHVDVIENAGNLDKLYQNGWSHNDIMRLLDQPEVDEEWAKARRFTKNYSEGGENNE